MKDNHKATVSLFDRVGKLEMSQVDSERVIKMSNLYTDSW
jgi:hypothetical protein